MKVRVFTLPWRAESNGFDDGELASFMAEHTAIDVSEHFFVHEKTPVLVLVVRYRSAGGASTGHEGRRTARPDAAEDLTPDEKAHYEALRTWRNQHARKTGRPPYVIFTNRQAAEIARRGPKTRSALADIQGIGTSRVEDFGDELLAFLGSLLAPAERAESGPESRDVDDG